MQILVIKELEVRRLELESEDFLARNILTPNSKILYSA